MTLRIELLALPLMTLAGCQVSLPAAIGDQCDLNSDCDAPLICRFGNCRVECDDARDCAAGFDCIFDNMQRGGCQLEADLGCALNSDCPGQLVCTMGECTNACGCGEGVDPPCMSPDCAPGAACILSGDGTTACLDTSTTGCAYDSDCPPRIGDDDISIPFEICAADGRCRIACVDSEDCRNGEECLTVMFTRPDGDISGPLCVFTSP